MEIWAITSLHVVLNKLPKESQVCDATYGWIGRFQSEKWNISSHLENEN